MDSDRDTLAGGLPHSEIPGSTIARISPGLIAACHALHRLSVPRHPPDALITLVTGHRRSNARQNPPLTGTKTTPPITDRPDRHCLARDAYSREDTLPQRQVNIPSRPSPSASNAKANETPASVTLSSPCQRTLPKAVTSSKPGSSTIAVLTQLARSGARDGQSPSR